MQEVILYTDGSCLGNPGPGGWASILSHEASGRRLELCGGLAGTTNNRMEILAVLAGLRALKEPVRVTVVTDSQYVSNSIAKGWVHSWRAKNWKVKDGKGERLNADLWKALLKELERHQVTMRWIRGHAGHPENERCDTLARDMARRPDLPRDRKGVADEAIPMTRSAYVTASDAQTKPADAKTSDET